MSNSDQFRMEGNQVISVASNKVAAVIENGVLTINPGWNTMTRKIRAFVGLEDAAAAEQAAAGEEKSGEAGEAAVNTEQPDDAEAAGEEKSDEAGKAAGNTEQPDDAGSRLFVGDAPAVGGTTAPQSNLPEIPEDARLVIDSIPDDELPDLDPVRGIDTKSFRLFCKMYKLTEEQITALVRRIELKMRG